MTTARTDDAGTTLMEVMVTMGIMSVVMAVFTGAILQMYQATVRTETSAAAAAEIRQAFQQLDKELRYASWFAPTPGKVGTSWYEEFADADGGCGQLRVDIGATVGAGVLQMLRWTAGSPPAAGQRGQTLASRLVVDPVVSPFLMQAAGTTAAGAGYATDYQRLQVRLTARVNRVTTPLDSTFTAINTSRVSPTTNVCSEGRP